MKALKLFSMAALALVMAACAKEANFSNEPEQQSGMHFHATLMAPNSGTDTKTVYTQVGTTIRVAWKVDDQIAVICNGVKDVVTVTAVDGSGNATIEGTITSSPADDANVLMYYPAAFVSGMDELVPIFDYSKWESQDGTLAYIQEHLDVRHATPKVTVSGSDVTLKGSVSMESDAAIWKVSLTNGIVPLEATGVSVKVGSTTVAGASASAKNEYYIGLIPMHMGTGDLTINATDGTKTYSFAKAGGVSLTAGKYYQSTVTMAEVLVAPLTLEATTAGTIVVSNPKSGMQYSMNGGAKTEVTSAPIPVTVGDKVAFYGDGTRITSYYDSVLSEGTSIGGVDAKVIIYGNIMSLVDELGFATATTLTANHEEAFSRLFKGNTNLTDASGLLLPATTLSDYCYEYMFSGCTSLTATPVLPATTLSTGCYMDMFSGCTSLTTAPVLPATTLGDRCYAGMFYECTSLTTIDADLLPVTTLTYGCYMDMFAKCSNLISAPKLNATTLAENCYSNMFSKCSSLETAPVLPAPVLAVNCYSYMFEDCTKLSSITCLATDISAEDCTLDWLTGVSATGTFTTPSTTAWTEGGSGIPSGWSRNNYVPTP